MNVLQENMICIVITPQVQKLMKATGSHFFRLVCFYERGGGERGSLQDLLHELVTCSASESIDY